MRNSRSFLPGVALAALWLACAERTSEGDEEDAVARAACDERCEHLGSCEIDDEIVGDQQDCSDACLTNDPWVWSDCRRESLELYACAADLTCDELRVFEGEELAPDPIENRPCPEQLEAYSACFTNLDD